MRCVSGVVKEWFCRATEYFSVGVAVLSAPMIRMTNGNEYFFKKELFQHWYYYEVRFYCLYVTFLPEKRAAIIDSVSGG